MWYVDLLLGNDSETKNETTSVARQQILDKQQLNYNRGMAFSTPSVPRCFKQDNWSIESVTGIPRPVRTSAEDIFRICYQETTIEDIEDFMFAAITVIFRRCKRVRLL
jgi:transcription initiation factor TFIIIB Brf1 subunit/transcription initiation factor TFIIB